MSLPDAHDDSRGRLAARRSERRPTRIQSSRLAKVVDGEETEPDKLASCGLDEVGRLVLNLHLWALVLGQAREHRVEGEARELLLDVCLFSRCDLADPALVVWVVWVVIKRFTVDVRVLLAILLHQRGIVQAVAALPPRHRHACATRRGHGHGQVGRLVGHHVLEFELARRWHRRH